MDDILIHAGKNPKSYPLDPGLHSMKLIVTYSGSIEPIYVISHEVLVKQERKVLKPKKLRVLSDSGAVQNLEMLENNKTVQQDKTTEGEGAYSVLFFLS